MSLSPGLGKPRSMFSILLICPSGYDNRFGVGSGRSGKLGISGKRTSSSISMPSGKFPAFNEGFPLSSFVS